MQCYTDLIPPTAVTCATALPFLNPASQNLVVAKTSLLQVFDIVTTTDKDKNDAVPKQRLVLVGEYTLSGTVTGLARVKALETKNGGEALLVAFKDAKLSLIEWDQENYRISTISIHYYEGRNLTNLPFGPDLSDCESILAVDPDSRCAALKFGTRQLAILPFRQVGDDIIGDEEDGDNMDISTTTLKRQDSSHVNGNGDAEQTPYKASFVLPLTALDPSLSHVVHLTFLYEYREPTFGILASSAAPSSALLAERKDALTYTVFTLDLEQRASTNLISVPKLPSSLWKVMPLPLPIGGALLVGTNEFIHIDQSGKANATAVNEFAKLESDFGMIDQSDLNMRLEDCVLAQLDYESGHLLVVLNDGSLATIVFQKLGRSVSGLHVSRINTQNGGESLQSAPSCIAKLNGKGLFLGSEDGPSLLLDWTQPHSSLSRKRSHAQMFAKTRDGLTEEEDDEDDEDVDDDDLYEAAPSAKKRAVSAGATAADDPSSFSYFVNDSLPSLGPTNDVCFGRSVSTKGDKLHLLASTGRGKASRLSFMSRDIVPQTVRETQFSDAQQIWTVATRRAVDPEPKSESLTNLLFVSSGEHLNIYDIGLADDSSAEFTERNAPEFEHEGETLHIDTILQETQIVQFRKTEIRTYDSNITLSQIIPMIDEETDADLNITSVSVCDPYLLVIRDDSSAQVLQVQGKELEPLEGDESFSGKTWLSGCLYSGALTGDAAVLFLLNGEGGLSIFNLPDLQLLSKTQALPFLPPIVSLDTHQRRVGTRETLSELLVADLGHADLVKPYLILRSALDELVLYEPFHYPVITEAESWHTSLRLRKVPGSFSFTYFENGSGEEQRSGPGPMRPLRIGEYSAVHMPGLQQSLLLRENFGLPKLFAIRHSTVNHLGPTLASLNQNSCSGDFAMLDSDGGFRECRLAQDSTYSLPWTLQQLQLSLDLHEIRQLAYFESRGLYIIAACKNVDFVFSEEDTRHPDQDEITFKPQIPQFSVHLFSSRSNKILDSFELPYFETITNVKVMHLEVSESTHARRDLIVVGTAAQRGEDMPSKGAVLVFDIVDVVPEPEVPESGFKLQLLSREETKGAVTALDVFPGGLVGIVQGQKLMVRGLKEDGTCLPVAFLDALCHIHTIKTLGGTGMWLAGDAWKGLWFGGFTEEPYKLTTLGKSRTRMEIISAEFLPFDGNLFLLAIDANTHLHVLQYDPENPKTVSGMRLLHRSTFHIGHFPSSMTLLPSTLAPFAQQQQALSASDPDREQDSPLFHVLTTSHSGAISLITPVDESTYRRLSALHTHLSGILEHAAGLNPRAYRAIESEGFGARGVVDGSLVMRISELNSVRRADVLARAGSDAWTLKSDLEVIGGGGLGFL